MSEVRYIQLNENRLRGPIPEAIGGMQKLTQLLLDRNELEGTIPTQIGLLTSLRSALTLVRTALTVHAGVDAPLYCYNCGARGHGCPMECKRPRVFDPPQRPVNTSRAAADY